MNTLVPIRSLALPMLVGASNAAAPTAPSDNAATVILLLRTPLHEGRSD